VPIARILRSRSRTFVVIGWLLFIISIPICLSVIVGTAINLTYFAASPQLPFDAYDNKAAWIFLVSVAFASLASLIALALKFRATASALVVLTWITSIGGMQAARLFVKPGPEYFERYVGKEVFLVPWKYMQTGPGVPLDKMPKEDGFSANLCLSNLGGRTDAGCSFMQSVHVLPIESSSSDPDLRSWSKFRSQMKSRPDRNGYQSFDLTGTLPSGHPLVEHYFARLNSDGQLTRLVVCHANSEKLCTTHALVGNFWLGYQAGLSEADEALDGKLAGLIESWRRK
jgi:hypothetical protein